MRAIPFRLAFLALTLVIFAASLMGCDDNDEPIDRLSVGPASFAAPRGLELSRQQEFPEQNFLVCFNVPGEYPPCSRHNVSLVVSASAPGPPYRRLPIPPYEEVIDVEDALASLEKFYNANPAFDINAARPVLVDGESGIDFRLIIGGTEVEAFAIFRLEDGQTVLVEYQDRHGTSTDPFDDVLDSLRLRR